jgi:hypothetical protein
MSALLSLLPLVLAGPPATAAADVVVLRDGRFVLGQVVEPAPRGKLRLVVRRGWVREHLPDRAAAWERSEAAYATRARQQRLRRLEAWRRQRPENPHDRINRWLDTEITRLKADAGDPLAPLLIVELAASEVRRLDRRPPETARLLRQAWRAGLDEPETRPIEELRARLEGRGFALSEVDPAPLDDLIALPLESEAQWLARRAATEVRDDRSLWWIRYQGLVLPADAQGGAGNLATAGAALKGLLGGEPPEDPLAEPLRMAEAKGRVGVVVTSLELGEDLAAATVEATLWVCLAPGRWTRAVVRPARVPVGAIPPEAAEPLGNDPQVQAAFRLLEGLGSGALGDDVRRRSLAVGAATRQALGMAQSALARDLEGLALRISP